MDKKNRLGRDIKLDNISSNIRVSIGCVDRLNPVVIYINGKTWAKSDDGDFTEDVQEIIYRKMNNIVRRVVCDNVLFKNKYIFDFDLNLCGQNPDKSKFVTFELYLTQDREVPYKINEIKDAVGGVAFEICNEMSAVFEDNLISISKIKNE